MESSGLYIYVMGLCNFFFVPQDLIDRIFLKKSYFSDENKQPSLELCCIYLKGEFMAESRC